MVDYVGFDKTLSFYFPRRTFGIVCLNGNCILQTEESRKIDILIWQNPLMYHLSRVCEITFCQGFE